MSPPPTLVWSHLFPADVVYVPDEGSDHFVEGLHTCGGDGLRKVLVVAGHSRRALANLASFHGIAALNRRDLSDEALRSAGFGHVRRFAMLPTADQLRWLIPLDAPAVSAGALDLYAAVRTSARVKLALVRGAARAGLHVWYRDELLVALRHAPPLEVRLGVAIGEVGVRLGISSGALGPSERRKPSVAVVDGRGTLRAVAKIAVSPFSEDLVRHEAATLRALEGSASGAFAPRVLFAGMMNERYTLVQSPLQGRPPGPELTAAHHRFLDALRRPGHRSLMGTGWGRALRDRVMRLPSAEGEFVEQFRTVDERLGNTALPLAMVHGDFAPWNLRGHDGAIAACDWENATLDGVALVDEINHRLSVGHLLRDWGAERAARALQSLAATRPLGLGAAVVETLAGACALEFCIRLIAQGHTPADAPVLWYREVMRRLLASAAEERGALVER